MKDALKDRDDLESDGTRRRDQNGEQVVAKPLLLFLGYQDLVGVDLGSRPGAVDAILEVNDSCGRERRERGEERERADISSARGSAETGHTTVGRGEAGQEHGRMGWLAYPTIGPGGLARSARPE